MKRKQLPWPMLPVIFTLAWPTMVEEFMGTAVQYIDTAMVGTLGTEATAAVGATSTVNWLLGGTVSAIGVGFLSFIARAYGANDREQAAKVTSQATLAVLFSGILFTILTLSLSQTIPRWMQVDPAVRSLAGQYFFILYLAFLPRAASIIYGTALRAAGDTKTPMRVGVLVNLINVVLNALLIYPAGTLRLFGWGLPGAGMGVLGAAAASAAAYTFGGVTMTVRLWRHPVISPKGRSIRPDWSVLKPCLKVAVPNMLQRFGTSLGYVAFASMINSLGEISTAAHTIANTVESAFYIPGYGMQTAAATLAGNALGAHDRQRLRDLTRMMIPIEVILMIVSGGLLLIFAPNLMRIFSASEAVILLGSTVLRMVAVSEPFYGVSIIIEGILQGLGQTMRPFIYSISCMWGVRIVGTFICVHFLNGTLVSAWACMIAHNLLLFALLLIYYLRGRWDPMRNERTAA